MAAGVSASCRLLMLLLVTVVASTFASSQAMVERDELDSREVNYCDEKIHPAGCIVPSRLNYILTFVPETSIIPGDRHNPQMHFWFPKSFDETCSLTVLFHGEHGHATDWFKTVDVSVDCTD